MMLLVETSGDVCVVALCQGGVLLEVDVQPHGNRLSKDLLPAIDVLLKRRGLTPRDLTGIALGIGPGSYTGTRVGAAVAKGLSFSLQIPIIPFCSLLAFIPENIEGDFCLLLPSKAGPLFAVEGIVRQGILGDVSSKTYEELPPISHTVIDPAHYPVCHLAPLVSWLPSQPECSPEHISLIYLAQIPLKNISALL